MKNQIQGKNLYLFLAKDKEMDRVCKVIENGACAEIVLRGEDESYECLADILDNSGIAPEQRADILINGTVRM